MEPRRFSRCGMACCEQKYAARTLTSKSSSYSASVRASGSRARGDPRAAGSHALPLTSAHVPPLTEQVEVDRPARVRGNDILVECDSEPGAPGQWERPIAHGRNPARSFAHEGIDEVVEVL